MSGLPTQIPIQSLPLTEKGPDGEMYVQFDWYLFLYNLAQQVFGTGGSGTTPVSPFDALDGANLLAQTAELAQVSRQLANGAVIDAQNLNIASIDIQRLERAIANLRAMVLASVLPDPTPTAQPIQTVTPGASPFTYTALANGVISVTGGSVSVVSLIRQGVSVATGVQSFTDEKGSGGTVGFAAGVDFTAGTTTTLTLSQNYGSAANLWIAFDGVEQGADGYSLSGTTLTFTSAIPLGTTKVYVKGGRSSGGLIPVRRLDQVQITYTIAPTIAFIPQ